MSLTKRHNSPIKKDIKGIHSALQEISGSFISPLTHACSILLPLDQLEEIKHLHKAAEEAFEAAIHQELVKSKTDGLIDRKLTRIDKFHQETVKAPRSAGKHIKNEYVIQPSQQSSQKLVVQGANKSQIKSPRNERRVALAKQSSKTPKKSKSRAAPNEKLSTEKEDQAASRSRPAPKSKSLSRKRVNHVKKEIPNHVEAIDQPMMAAQDPPESVKNSEQLKNTSLKNASSSLKNQNSKISKKTKNFMDLEKLGKQTIQSAIKKVENPENEGIMNEVAAAPKESSKKLNGKRNRKVDEYFEQKFRKMSIEDDECENADPNQEKAARKEHHQLGNARQKVDQDGNSLKIEKKLTQKRQYAESPAANFQMFQSKKKLKEKSEQLLNEALKVPQVNCIKYEDSRNVVGFEKSLKSGIISQNLNTSMRNATIKSDHLNFQSIAKNSGQGETQRILAQKNLNQSSGYPIQNGIPKLYAGIQVPLKSTDDTSQKSQNAIDPINAMQDAACVHSAHGDLKKAHKTDQEMAIDAQNSEENIVVEQRRIDKLFGRENVNQVLNENEIDVYEEFLEPSETRFSKTNIFINYKEFHNRRNLVETNRQMDKKHFTKQMRIVNKDKQIDKKMPCWASDLNLIRKVQNIQNKLSDSGLLKDHLQFETTEEKRDFLRPKVEQLCSLMDREYEINYAKLKKQREEQRRKQLQMAGKSGLSHQIQGNHNSYLQKNAAPHGTKMSRAAMLAQGYNFSNPKGQQLVQNLNMHQRIGKLDPNILGGQQ